MKFFTTILLHAVVNADQGIVGNSWSFIFSGIRHIIPLGWDHILFIMGLFLSTRSLNKIIRLATAFTVAHSLTLILCATQLLPSRPQMIEPIIGLTIAMVGVQNILGEKNSKVSYLIVFIFGLIHGCGFASALGESGIPEKYFYSSLVCFNIGIELAQIAIIGLLYLICKLWTNEIQYKKFVVTPVSLIIIAAGIFLTTERLIH
jgi:hypothetical protein